MSVRASPPRGVRVSLCPCPCVRVRPCVCAPHCVRVCAQEFPEEFRKTAPPQVLELIAWLLKPDPAQRPTADALLESSYLPGRSEIERAYVDEAVKVRPFVVAVVCPCVLVCLSGASAPFHPLRVILLCASCVCVRSCFPIAPLTLMLS